MTKQDNQIIRSAKLLAQKECANYANDTCLPEDHPCYLINPAYKTIHDGTVDCDYFLSADLPLQPELNTGVWHEILREEDQTGEGRKAAFDAISLSSPAATASAIVPSVEQRLNKPGIGKSSAAIGSVKKQAWNVTL